MTTCVLADIEPLPTDVTEPMWAFTASELADRDNDNFRRGYRLGRVHEAEDGAMAAHLATPPTARTA